MWRSWTRPGDASDALREVVEENEHAALEDRLEPLREAGIPAVGGVRWGKPWVELIRAVVHDRHDLVVKTAEGAARGTGLFFGSTALHLIRKCPCPVWIAGNPSDAESGQILAAVNPHIGDPTRFALASRILNLAAGLVGVVGERLDVAAVWRAEGESLLRDRVPAAELESYVRQAKQDAQAGLAKALGELPGAVARGARAPHRRPAAARPAALGRIP